MNNNERRFSFPFICFGFLSFCKLHNQAMILFLDEKNWDNKLQDEAVRDDL